MSIRLPSALETLIAFTANRGLYIALPLIFVWFGGMKFTSYEAGAIEGLIANSPFVSFLLPLLGQQGASNLIGTVEIAIAVLLVLRFANPVFSIFGALGAVGTFLITSSFFLSTPGVFLDDLAFPAISVVPGQFLLKDIGLLVASVWALHESLTAQRG